MSDEIQDTPDGAIRSVLGTIGFILILIGAEMIKENYHLPIAWFLVLLGIGCYFALVLWKSLKRYFRAHVLTDISAIATSPRWWLAILGIFLLAVIFSPYVEQHRLPFIQTQNEDITGSIPTRILDGDTPWLTVALKEYDQARLVGPQSNPRILEYLQSIPGAENLTDKVDWASAFAEWSLNRVGIENATAIIPQ